MKTYLCKEGNEKFTINARNMKEALKGAAIFNAVVIREVTKRSEEQKGPRIK